MANPLMRVMLNNILIREGKKTSSDYVQIAETVYSSNLKKEQESLLVASILKAKTDMPYEGESKASYKAKPAMVTLEDLRSSKGSENIVKAEQKEEKINNTIVTLASIGKLNKKQ